MADTAASAPASLAPVHHSVLDLVGNTPMLELRRLDAGPCRLFAKLELMNPSGSIKDRIGVSMIEAAEREGRIDPNADPKPTLIEATAGNTGLALALVACQRGYELIVVVPDKMAAGKIQHLRAMGAEVVMARSDVTRGHPEYYQEVAARIARNTDNSFFVNQFFNEANVAGHYERTGPEIAAQIDADTGAPPDVLIVGVGSGGTLTGCGRALRERFPDIEIILADPAGSILHPLVNEGREVEPGSWMVEGMGEDFVPSICDLDLVNEAIPVTDAEAFYAARTLLRKEGLLAGSSTGALIHAALEYCRRQTEPKTVVTFICDQGAKYLDKFFNDYWMIDNGFIEREPTNDLRDLVARRHELQEDYTLKPDDPVKQAVTMMRLYSVSQMAVLDDKDKVVGIIDEGDILLAMTQEEDASMDKPISEFMTRRLETLPPEAPVERLLPIFRADRVAIVADESKNYYGLITKIDFINYLRRRTAWEEQPAPVARTPGEDS